MWLEIKVGPPKVRVFVRVDILACCLDIMLVVGTKDQAVIVLKESAKRTKMDAVLRLGRNWQ